MRNTLQKALFIENEKGGIRKDERQKKHRISCRWHAAFSSFETVAICLSSEDWDFIVIPAAVFFVLAILHSLPAFKALYRTAQGARQANIMATLASLAVVSFQIMMILIIGNNNWLGLLLLVPCVAMGALFGFKWFQNIVRPKG